MREHEWDWVVREPLRSAAAGARVLVLVEGEAGMGKTRFVRWLLARPELAQAPRLTMTFTASGASVLREPACSARTVSAVAEDGSLHRPRILESGSSAPLAAASLRELAASPGTDAPMLLVAEDIDRAHEQDASALRAVLAHPPAGLRAVLTYRPEELASPGLVLGAPVGYPAELTLVRMRLGPLGEAEVRRMAVEALGEDRCSARFIARLCERSGGNAQVVADLVEELKTAGLPSGRSATVVGLVEADGKGRGRGGGAGSARRAGGRPHGGAG